MNLEAAIMIAFEAHAGQFDKAGEPYILHPLRVMLSLETEEERIVGVLHDVMEDSDWTDLDLANQGFEYGLIQAVVSLTRHPSETYQEFIARCGEDPLARKVKLADIADNLSPERASSLPDCLRRRYETARSSLEERG